MVIEAFSARESATYCIVTPWERRIAMQMDAIWILHVFPRQLKHFLTGMSIRVEHQKLNEVAAPG